MTNLWANRTVGAALILNLLLVLVVAASVRSEPDSSRAAAKLPLIPSNAKWLRSIAQTCPLDPAVLPRRFMLYWGDGPGIDGDYIVVIHPTQLFLRTTHDNPNPSKLYSFMPLRTDQYELLVRFLDEYDGYVLSRDTWLWTGYTVYRLRGVQESPFHPDYATNEEMARWDEAVEDLGRSNLRRIMRELNRALPPDGKLPEDPDIFDVVRRPTILD